MSEKMHESYRMAELITKHILGEASDDEKRRLQEWLDASPAHAREYAEWTRRLQHDLTQEEPSAQAAWQQFNRRLHPRRRSFFRSAYGYASAAVLVLAVLIAGVAYFHQEESSLSAAIVPGSAKAQLITESGEDVEIKPQSPLQLQLTQSALEREIRNEDGILHYDEIELPADSLKDMYHTLSVPKGGEYQLILADGSHIFLNSDSQINYPVVFTESDSVRRVSVKGEAYFNVAHNENKPFEVHTQHGIIRVLGTQFNVHDYADEEQTIITLTNGSIVYDDDMGKEYLLRPKEQIVIQKASGEVILRKVPDSSYYSWIDGVFEFNGMPLELIMKQLSRWYDVDYHFDTPELMRHQFTGITYRHSTLEGLLQLIEKTTSIHFNIKERTIYISN